MPTAGPPTGLAAGPRSTGDLFRTFSLIALQGFGGVLAVVQRELVERRGWLTREQFVEDWAVAQVLPGPNVVNLALMLGDRHFGWRGALAALAGMLTLPLGLLIGLAVVFAGLDGVPAAQGALRGMGAVAAGLVAGTAVKLIPALARNPLGRAGGGVVIALVFGAVALARLPLWAVLAAVGLPACVVAFHRLGDAP
jgi:chromate transporter